MNPSRKNRNPPKAFTVLEVLVSSAILGIVMLVMLAAVDTGMRLWKSSQDKINVDREARTPFSVIAEDLKTMVNPPSGPAPVFQTPPAGGGIFMEFLVRKPRDYQSQNSTTAPGNIGDVCYVRYTFRNNQILRGYADSAATFPPLNSTPPRFPSSVTEEVLAVNIRNVFVGTQGPNGVMGTSPTRTAYYSIEAAEATSFGPNAPRARVTQYFTATALVPPPLP